MKMQGSHNWIEVSFLDGLIQMNRRKLIAGMWKANFPYGIAGRDQLSYHGGQSFIVILYTGLLNR